MFEQLCMQGMGDSAFFSARVFNTTKCLVLRGALAVSDMERLHALPVLCRLRACCAVAVITATATAEPVAAISGACDDSLASPAHVTVGF
jgi:hypothetical protein